MRLELWTKIETKVGAYVGHDFSCVAKVEHANNDPTKVPQTIIWAGRSFHRKPGGSIVEFYEGDPTAVMTIASPAATIAPGWDAAMRGVAKPEGLFEINDGDLLIEIPANSGRWVSVDRAIKYKLAEEKK